MRAHSLVVGSVAMMIGLGPPTPTPTPELPHIVVILADDLGYGDLSCYNPESKIETTSLDRLAREGLRFTDAHSPSAVCSPTRYGLLTGSYCWRTRLRRGIVGGFDPLLIAPKTLTLPELLRRAGYATACVGKWHLGIGEKLEDDYLGATPRDRPKRTDYTKPLAPGPNACGFDYFFGSVAKPGRGLLEFDEQSPEWLASWFIENETLLVGDPKEWEQSEVGPILTRKAVEIIEEHAEEDPDRPLFLYLSLTAVHEPFHPPEFLRGKSGAGEYGDFVLEVDWTVEKVIEALEEAGMLANTMLVFTSDNGPEQPKLNPRFGHRSPGPFRGWKRDLWEGGHRIPFIVRWPGRVEPDTSSDEVICLTDLMATCAAIVGVDLPEGAGTDSYDLGPVLLGKELEGPLREATVFHSSRGEFAIRQGRWKLIACQGSGGNPYGLGKNGVKPGDPPGQLFDMLDDPGETTNLYDEHPKIVRSLTELLERYEREGRSRP